MSADIHVDGIDFNKYLNDTEAFLTEYDYKPSFDVTWLRDSTRIPEHTTETLYNDTLSPREVLLVADALHYIRMDHSILPDELEPLDDLIIWLRYWGENGYSISGMH